MNRRHFLSLSGLVSSSCLIPAALARRVQEVCINNRKPLLITPHDPGFTLYAEGRGGSFLLHGSYPWKMPAGPTLREFIESEGYDLDSKQSLCYYFLDVRKQELGYNPDDGTCQDECSEDAIDILLSDLDTPICEFPVEFNRWQLTRDSWEEDSETKGYRFLSGLWLGDDEGGDGLMLGNLTFTEEDGQYGRLVEAADLATLACLQHRLNTLNKNTKIEIL